MRNRGLIWLRPVVHLTLAAVLASWDAIPLASTASTPLTVSVTVARSCVVRTTPLEPGFAAVHLTCVPAAAADVKQSDAGEASMETPGTVSLRMPTTAAPTRVDTRVVTVNF
jgi:hypothetical protein